MKITKDLLWAMRRDAKAGRILQLSPEEGVVFLDERKALRAELGDLVEWVEGMPDEALRAAEIRSALALGEDEE